jgi:hypothetical protein
MPHAYTCDMTCDMLHVGNVKHSTLNTQYDTQGSREKVERSFRATAEQTFSTMSLPSSSRACLLSSSCSADCDAVDHKDGHDLL